MTGPDIVAAGAVVARKGRVLLVHRPKYDDWSFPKGKQDPGETVVVTAVREVEEETGVRVALGRPLRSFSYPVGESGNKLVHYWCARVAGDADVSSYTPNAEIDEVAWVPVAEAAGRLSYALDRALLSEHLAFPRRTWPLVVLRHGHAHPRDDWTGDDRLRPLAPDGKEQARALPAMLSAYGVSRLVSSPSKRCLQTLRRAARRLELPVDREPSLSEEGGSPAGLLDGLLASREGVVVCTHRPVLPVILDRLGVTLPDGLDPGEMLVCHHREGRVVAAERQSPLPE